MFLSLLREHALQHSLEKQMGKISHYRVGTVPVFNGKHTKRRTIDTPTHMHMTAKFQGLLHAP